MGHVPGGLILWEPQSPAHGGCGAGWLPVKHPYDLKAKSSPCCLINAG